MARTHARIHTAIWTNDDFRDLDAATQRTYLLIVSQPDLSICGVLEYNPKRLARLATDTTAPKITKAVRRLEERRYVVVDPETDELVIRTFLRHDGVLDMPNPLKAAARAWKSIHSSTIRSIVVDALPAPIRAVWPDTLIKMDAKAIGELLRQPSSQPNQQPFPEPFAEPPGTYPLTLSGPLSSSPSTANAPPNGSPKQPAHLDDDFEPLWTELAQRRAEFEHPGGQGIGQPAAYMRKVTDDHRERLTARARTLRDEHPDWSIEDLADELDPDTAPRIGNYMDAEQTAEWLAQQARARAEAVPMPEHMRP